MAAGATLRLGIPVEDEWKRDSVMVQDDPAVKGSTAARTRLGHRGRREASTGLDPVSLRPLSDPGDAGPSRTVRRCRDHRVGGGVVATDLIGPVNAYGGCGTDGHRDWPCNDPVTLTDVPPELTRMMQIPQTSIQGVGS